MLVSNMLKLVKSYQDNQHYGKVWDKPVTEIDKFFCNGVVLWNLL